MARTVGRRGGGVVSDFRPLDPPLFADITDAIAYSRLVAEVNDERLAEVVGEWSA